MQFWRKMLWRALCCCGLLLAGAVGAGAEEEWQERFEALCARTGEVMSLTPAELQGLLDECAALRPRVEALPESPRKVYRKRLALACNMVQFALDQKSAPPPQQ